MNEELVKVTQLKDGCWVVETQFATAIGKRKIEALQEVGLKVGLARFAVMRTVAAITEMIGDEMIGDEVKDMEEE